MIELWISLAITQGIIIYLLFKISKLNKQIKWLQIDSNYYHSQISGQIELNSTNSSLHKLNNSRIEKLANRMNKAEKEISSMKLWHSGIK